VSEHERPEGAAERAARDAVRGLSRPPAEAAFRARLREQFTTGRFGRRGLAIVRPWFAQARVLLPLAAGLLLVTGLALNRGPDWRMVAANGEGRVVLDGVSYAANNPALAKALRTGGRLRVEGALTLDLVAPGQVAVALAPGAEVELSSSPGRWWGRTMQARLTAGDAYFTTGRAFHGAHLDVHTPEVSVRAVGTAFAVLREAELTCVCVMEGRVRVGSAGAAGDSAVEVAEGMRRVVHADQRSETAPILDASMNALHRQRTVTGDWLHR
jgi:hypothetical protein